MCMRMPVREPSSGHAQEHRNQVMTTGVTCKAMPVFVRELFSTTVVHAAQRACVLDRSTHAQPCVHKTVPSARMYVHASLFDTHHPTCLHLTEHTHVFTCCKRLHGRAGSIAT